MPFRHNFSRTSEVRCCGKIRDTRFCGSCGGDLRLREYVAFGHPDGQKGTQEVRLSDDGEGIDFIQERICTFKDGITCAYLDDVGTPLMAEVRLPYKHYGFGVDFRNSPSEENECEPDEFHLSIEVRTDETGAVKDVVIKKTLPEGVQIREEYDDYNDPPANGND